MLEKIQAYLTTLSRILLMLMAELERKISEEVVFLEHAKETETLLRKRLGDNPADSDQKILDCFSQDILTMERSNKNTDALVKKILNRLKKAVRAYKEDK